MGIGSKEAFKRGVELVSNGQVDAALEAFQEGLNNTVKDREKGSFLYNIAACQFRLGRDGLAIDALDKAIIADPWLVPRVRRDKDFAGLRDTEAFQTLFEKHQWRYVRTWRWYLAWFFGGSLLGFVLGVVSKNLDPIDRAVHLGAMSLPLAWFIGKLIEGVFAFRQSSKGTGGNTVPLDQVKMDQLDETTPNIDATCPACGHKWMGNWDKSLKERQCPECWTRWSLT
jgi:hypothetical protein